MCHRVDREMACISIHALLAESDDFKRLGLLGWLNFYPRSPCGERPHPIGVFITVIEISIHALLAESDPARPTANNATTIFLSTLSLRRATFGRITSVSSGLNFYPRSPCGERQKTYYQYLKDYRFLSTLSLRRATGYQRPYARPTTDFYPRSPCGERLEHLLII